MNGEEVIRSLEQELDVTQQRCHAIERTIEQLREIWGLQLAPTNGRAPKAKKTRKTFERTRRMAPGVARKSLPDDHVAAVVEAIKKKGGASVTLADLEAKLDVSRYKTVQYVEAALKAKAIVSTGSRVSYRLHLPGRVPAKEDL